MEDCIGVLPQSSPRMAGHAHPARRTGGSTKRRQRVRHKKLVRVSKSLRKGQRRERVRGHVLSVVAGTPPRLARHPWQHKLQL